jgi:hypothetical protein
MKRQAATPGAAVRKAKAVKGADGDGVSAAAAAQVAPTVRVVEAGLSPEDIKRQKR